MVELNKSVVNWLEEGHLREALVGQQEYFLADHSDPNSHDLMLVMYVVINWAFQTDRTKDTGLRLQKVILELVVSQPEAAMDILLAYAITARDQKKQLPYDVGHVFESLQNKVAKVSSQEGSTRPDVANRLAHLRKRLLDLGVSLKS